MKVSEITIKATIPTGQYANIQPEIKISEVENIAEASQFGIEWMKENFERFSEKGPLTDKEITVNVPGAEGSQKKSLLTKI